MSGIALVAAKGAVASVLSTSLPHIAPSAFDGFAAGTMLSGLLVLLVMARRQLARQRRTSAYASSALPTSPYLPALAISDPFDEAAEVVVALPRRPESSPSVAPAARGRHRLYLADPPARQLAAARQPAAKRHCGRHAAPPIGVASRMAGRFALSPQPLAD